VANPGAIVKPDRTPGTAADGKPQWAFSPPIEVALTTPRPEEDTSQHRGPLFREIRQPCPVLVWSSDACTSLTIE
jgi:hypothetical protein